MSAPALKRFRVVVIEWLSHDAIIEGRAAAEAAARRLWATNDEHQLFSFDDSGNRPSRRVPAEGARSDAADRRRLPAEPGLALPCPPHRALAARAAGKDLRNRRHRVLAGTSLRPRPRSIHASSLLLGRVESGAPTPAAIRLALRQGVSRLNRTECQAAVAFQET